MYIMKFKVYFEDSLSSMGGNEVVSFTKLIWWLFRGRIKPKENSTIYYIKKIETENGNRI
jgi:hypothetical protein